MKKVIVVMLILSLLSLGFATPYESGYVNGKRDAQEYNAGGWMIGGFLSGIALGLIGTGICYVLAGGEVETPETGESGSSYRVGYERGYQQVARSKNQNTELISGLLGTLVIVASVH